MVVQGFGNAGAIAARLLAEDGATIIAVSDSQGGIYNSKGIDPIGALRYKQEHGSLSGFAGSDDITNEATPRDRVRHTGARRSRKRHHRPTTPTASRPR